MSESAQTKTHGVVVSAMPLSSPTLPGLSSGSSSPSISSVDTAEGRVVMDSLTPVITSRGPMGSRVEISSSSSSSNLSWNTAAQALDGLDGHGRMYVCLFHMLDCHDSFDDESEWRTHVFSHFRTHPPPSTARCPLCPDTNFVDGDSDTMTPVERVLEDRSRDKEATSMDHTEEPPAWDRMLDHVAMEHYQHGQTLAGSRPDFELMRYLYGRRIISDAQFKAMQLAPAPSSPAYHRSQDGVRASIGSSDEPYYAPYSRRREERIRGQQRGVCLV